MQICNLNLSDERRHVVPIVQDQDGLTLIGVMRSLREPMAGEPCRLPAPKPSRSEWLRLSIIMAFGIASIICLMAGA